MKKILIAALLASIASPALACTEQDVQAKAAEVSAVLQQIAATHPAKMPEINERLAAAKANMPTDPDGACKFYDEVLARLNSLK